MMMLYEKFSYAEGRIFIREGESQINVYFGGVIPVLDKQKTSMIENIRCFIHFPPVDKS
jgi:hypothetical protein